MKFRKYLNEIGFKTYPKGWDKSSVKKFADTLSKNIGKGVDEHGWFDACVLKMKKEMGDGAKGFCASVKDEYMGQTKWRGGDKTIKEEDKCPEGQRWWTKRKKCVPVGTGKKEKKKKIISDDIKENDNSGGNKTDLRVTKRIFKKKFDSIKNDDQLDKLYTTILKQNKKWNWSNFSKEEFDWLEQQFDKVSNRLGQDKFYRLGGKGKPMHQYGS